MKAVLWKIWAYAPAVLVLILVTACSASAGDWSLYAGAGGGNCKTVTGDMSLRYTFEALYGNEALEIRPLVEGSGVYWHHDADDDEWGGGLSGGFRMVFFRDGQWMPYVSGTFGAFLISDDEFGSHNMGGGFQFRSKGALGIQFGEAYRHSVQVDAAHFSNAGIYDENSGFNTFGITYGFRF